ncbi:MAG: hypothetical protein ACHREM_15135 [Polyangiales bacterium]
MTGRPVSAIVLLLAGCTSNVAPAVNGTDAELDTGDTGTDASVVSDSIGDSFAAGDTDASTCSAYPKDAVNEMVNTCTQTGSSCAACCFATIGQRIDLANNCVGPETTIACVDSEEGLPDYSCIRDSTGTAWRVADALLPRGPGWSSCSTAESDFAQNIPIPFCP